MVSAFFGASSTLAARLGVGRRVFSASHGHLLLDRWGFALDLGAEPAGRCVDTWRTCHDAFTARRRSCTPTSCALGLRAGRSRTASLL
jgi:hypothetical protein